LERLPAEVLAVVDRVKRDRRSGASQLTLLSLEALRLASAEVEADSLREFFGKLRLVGCLLSEAKPSMVSIANIAGRLLWELEKAAVESLSEARRLALNLSLKLAGGYREALRKAAFEASRLMAGVKAVATCSYSSLVLEAFRVAVENGLSFRVLAAESKVKGLSHGRNLAAKASSLGLKAEVHPDSKLSRMVKEASLVLLGADAVLPDGSIINGSPSLKLAGEAQREARSLYVVCDSFKISPSPMKAEEGFDLVPRELVGSLITEEGKTAFSMVREEGFRSGKLQAGFKGGARIVLFNTLRFLFSSFL